MLNRLVPFIAYVVVTLFVGVTHALGVYWFVTAEPVTSQPQDPLKREVKLLNYRGTMRWLCDNPDCPEGCAAELKRLGITDLKSVQTEPK